MLEVDDRGVLSVCSNCGTKNRRAFERLGDTVRCGNCKESLPGINEPLEIQSADDFERLVSHGSLPVVVDFWAPWCGPCRMVAPELAKVAARNVGRFMIVKVNTDALPDLGERFGIRSIPTLGVFVAGREAGRSSGARPAQDIEAFVGSALGKSAAAMG